ncbi:unnamed protein product [Ectocarpus sp. 12 AP-2014]
MMLVERDPSASFAEASRYVITASRKRRLLVEDTTAAAPRIPECCNTSRKRRKISPPMQPMETRRNRYSYQNNGRATTTTASRNSRRPASAKRASDVEGVRHVPLPKKSHQQEQHMDHHDALCGHFGTEYLGVSNVAFAPPLRRYLESPQHGRHALRSSKPSSSRPSTGLLGSRIRARAASAGMEAAHARRPISRSNKSWREGAACPDIDRYGHSSSCSTALSGENHERSASLEKLHSGSEQTRGTSPRHGLLIPVGPDWRDYDSSPSSSDADEPTSVRNADGNTHDGDDDGDRARETLSKIREFSLEIGEGAICGGGRTNGIDDADSRGSRHTSQRQEEGCTRHGGDNNFRGVATEGRTSKELCVRWGSRRRRIPRSTAWDLLTGRRVQPGRRKGSCDIRLSEEPPRFSEEHWMSQTDSRVHDVHMKPEPIGWEPSRTAPLDYPTPSVRRGVARFHEQIQRTRLMEGKEPLDGLPDVREPETGVRPATVVQRRCIQGMPPPLRWSEETHMVPGDILVTVEHCAACSRHRMSLHHNADAYIRRAAAMKTSAEQALIGAGRHPTREGQGRGPGAGAQSMRVSRTTSVVTKPMTEASASGGVGRVGAFEVQVTACLLSRQAPHAVSAVPRSGHVRQTSPDVIAGAGHIRSATVSSKLASGKWPHPERVARKIVQTLQQWGALVPQQPEQQRAPLQRCSSMGGTDHPSNVSGGKNRLGERESHTSATGHVAQEADTEEPNQGEETRASSGESGALGTTKVVKRVHDEQHGNGAELSSSDGEEMKGGAVELGVSDGRSEGGVAGAGRRMLESPDATTNNIVPQAQGVSNSTSEVSVSGTGSAARPHGGEAATSTVAPTMEAFDLSVEDACAEGVEFAAEGNTADPCLLLRVGKRKGRKSKPVADVPGGPGGQCRWPSQTCVVTSLREESIRSSGLEVEIWDDLGWIIAKGNVPPDEIGDALDVAVKAARAAPVTALSATEGSVPPPPPLPTVTCDLKSDRGPVNTGNGRVTFGMRLLRPENAYFASRHGEHATDEAVSYNAEAGDDGKARLSQTVQNMENGKVIRRVDTTTPVQGHTAEVQHGSNATNSPGKKAVRGDAGRVFDEINDLLGLTSNGSVSGSGMPASCSGAASTGSGPGGSGDSSFVLGDGLLGSGHHTSVDDLVGESWSSVEEGPLATSGQTKRESGGGLVERPRKLTASPAVSVSDNGGASADRNGVGGGVDPPAASLTLAPNAGGTADSSNPSDGVDADDYSEGDFDCDGANGGAEGPIDVRSLFSCSGASSSASLSLEKEEHSLTSTETRGATQHERDEIAVGAAARILRRRLRRAAERCGGGNLGAKAALLFNRLDEDQNGQLAVEELEKALAPTRGKRAERTENPVLPPSRVMAALVAGMDRVGKQSANLKEFQAFVLDVPGSGGNTATDAHTSPELSRGKVDMAALWLRLRRAAIEPSSRHHYNDDEAQRPISMSAVGTNGGGGEGRAEDHEVMLGERESWIALTWEGPVDVSSLGRERFEECDTEGSGSVSCHTFREVLSGPRVRIDPPLSEAEMESLCRHFDSNFKSNGPPVGTDRGGESTSNPPGREEENEEPMTVGWPANADAPVSYRAFLAWIDPIDVGRVAKRLSRFLRAVGDSSSKIGGPVAEQDGRDQGMPVRALAVMGPEVGVAKPGGARNKVPAAADMPKAREVTRVGLGGGTGASRAAASDAHGGADDADDDSVDGGVDVSGGGGHDGGGVETVERRAIVKLFRAVDVDASGHVSQEELLKAVNGLGLPVSEAEARLLVTEYGGVAGGGRADGSGGKGTGEGQLSLDDFDCMVRWQSRAY